MAKYSETRMPHRLVLLLQRLKKIDVPNRVSFQSDTSHQHPGTESLMDVIRHLQKKHSITCLSTCSQDGRVTTLTPQAQVGKVKRELKVGKEEIGRRLMVEPRGSGSWEAGSQYTYNGHMSGSLFITGNILDSRQTEVYPRRQWNPCPRLLPVVVHGARRTATLKPCTVTARTKKNAHSHLCHPHQKVTLHCNP